MTSNALAVDRRARRRRNLLLLLILAAVVAVIAVAVRYRTERRQTSDYLAVAESVVDQKLEMALSLDELMSALGDFERQDMLARLETMSANAQRVGEELAAAPVVRPVAEASGLLSVAVSSWARAVDSLDDAIILVLDSTDDDPAGEEALRRSFDRLRVGDEAYQLFLAAVAEMDSELVSSDFPEFAFVAAEHEALYDSAVVAQRLRTLRVLDETHDVAVTANTEPEPLGDQNGVFVVPYNGEFTVLAVITNEGNVDEEQIMVAMELISSDEEAEPVSVSQLIPFLQPGEARAIPFEQIPLSAGHLYELRLVVSITNDSDVTDNTFRMPFITNEAA